MVTKIKPINTLDDHHWFDWLKQPATTILVALAISGLLLALVDLCLFFYVDPDLHSYPWQDSTIRRQLISISPLSFIGILGLRTLFSVFLDRPLIAAKRHLTNRCQHCGYSLRGLSHRRCPECGTVSE